MTIISVILAAAGGAALALLSTGDRRSWFLWQLTIGAALIVAAWLVGNW